MLVLRMLRMGKKKNPFYRIVATDKRNAAQGKFNDILGYYNPSPKGEQKSYEINEEKALKWLGEGAQMSDTVRSVFKRAGILKNFHESKLNKTVEPKEEAAADEAVN